MMLIEPLFSKFRTKKMGIMGYRPAREDLNLITELFEAGHLAPVIDSFYPLENSVDAFRHFLSGKFVGKVVIEVGEMKIEI